MRARTKVAPAGATGPRRGLPWVTGKVGRFVRAGSGNVAIMFALAMLPIVIGGGAAVDYSRAFVVQQRLTAALDAAALAVGASPRTDEDALREIAQGYFDANYPADEIGVPGALKLELTDNTVAMSASAKLPTTIMNIAGIGNIDVGSNVQVTKERTGLELALVLDNTGSMRSRGKIDALKEASRELVDVLFGEESASDLLKFALVPFSSSVNVGTRYRNSGWIDVDGRSQFHGAQFRQGSRGSPIKNVFGAYDDILNKRWNGCVEARPAPYDTRDIPPDESVADSLWVPYFAPDEPDNLIAINRYYANSYTFDRLGSGQTDVDKRQRHRPKYKFSFAFGDGPHFNCANQPILPLTRRKSTILDAIDDMNAAGSTVIPIGLAWGWRTLSPGEPFTEGARYQDDSVKKVLILLTDGNNDIGKLNNHNRSFYSGYGYVGQKRLGTRDPDRAHKELDRRTAILCENVKRAGVLVYAISFQVSSTSTHNLMRNCATTPQRYFDSPTNGKLRETFREIAGQLGNLRISR